MKMELKKKAPGLVVKLLDENGSSLDIKDFASVSGNVEIYGDLPNRRVFVSLDGKTLNYIINGGNGAGQTKDLSIAINGETTATVEAADKK